MALSPTSSHGGAAPTLAQVLATGADTGGATITGGIIADAIAGIEAVNAKSFSAAADYQDALIVRNVANDHLFAVDTAGDAILAMKRDNAQVVVVGRATSSLPVLVVNAGSGQNFAVLASGVYITRANAAPADAALSAGDMAVWFDQTAGAAKLMVKAKNASGTVVTGSLALA